jgi:hypothetical protein
LLIKGKKYAPHELVEIARWAQDSIGYPVRIGLSNDEYICADKTSLEKVLLGVLVNSNVGLVVQSVHENQLREASTIAPASSARKPASVPDARSIANKVSVANIQGTIVDEPFAAFTLHKVATKRSSARKAIAAKPSAKAAPKTQARPAAKSVTKTGAKQAAKTTTRPVAKSASKPATKSVAKPAAKSVAKPAAKPAVKPIAKTAAKVISARH